MIMESPTKVSPTTKIAKEKLFSEKTISEKTEKTLSLKSIKTIITKASKSNKIFSRKFGSKHYVILLSLMQGLYSIATLACFMYQKDTLKMEPELIQFLSGIILFPWCIKPVFGYIFDKLILVVKKTKYIIIVTSSIRLILFLLMSIFNVDIVVYFIFSFLICLANLFENIICEYILVINTKKEHELNGDTSTNQLPIYFGFKSCGSLIGSFYGGRLINLYGINKTFFITAMVSFLNLFIALIYREKNHRSIEKERTFAEECKIMKELVMREQVFKMVIFVVLINMMPQYDSLTTFYLTDYLKFTTEDLANYNSISTFCYIIALIMYSYYFQYLDPKKFYMVTNFLYMFCSLSFLLVVLNVLDKYGIDNKFFCVFSQGVQSFISELNFMPVLAIWCAICPQNLEATSITVFTGLLNTAWNLASYFGAFLIWLLAVHNTNYENFWVLIIIQNGYLLIMIVGIMFIDFPRPFVKENLEPVYDEEINATHKVD